MIESPNDLNFSRSILFGYAVPFTHTGARLTYAATPAISLIAGVNRGWDLTRPLPASALVGLGAPPGTAGDGNSLTLEFGAAWNPSPAVSLTTQAYVGKPEDQFVVGCSQISGAIAVDTGCKRSLLDIVATAHLNSALTATVNIDAANQTNTTSAAFASGIGTVTWDGVAGYLSDAFTHSLTGTLRFETFDDAQGYRTATGVATHWYEGTATAQSTILQHVILRAEVRLDKANVPDFTSTHNLAGQSWLTTYALEAIVHAP